MRKILGVLALVAFVVFMIGACALDSESNVPFVMVLSSAPILMLYVAVNSRGETE